MTHVAFLPYLHGQIQGFHFQYSKCPQKPIRVVGAGDILVAETVGFEPTVPGLAGHALSRRAC